MARKPLFAGLALAAVSLSGAVAADDDVMSKLTALEGEWIMLDENGGETGVVGASFRLTSAGSVLAETMLPNSPDGHEMLNTYHADGERVLMTHYCAAGNQPRMEVRTTDDENRLELRFESITNLSSAQDHYMHHAEYIWRGEDRLTTRWYSMKDGKITEESPVIFELKRRK